MALSLGRMYITQRCYCSSILSVPEDDLSIAVSRVGRNNESQVLKELIITR